MISSYSKYRAKRTIVDGISFASKAEAKQYCDLNVLYRGGHIRGFVMQPRFRLGCAENVYVADFLVIQNDSTCYVIDVKGMETQKFKRDVKLWKRYGPCELRIVKNGKLVECVRGEGVCAEK